MQLFGHTAIRVKRVTSSTTLKTIIAKFDLYLDNTTLRYRVDGNKTKEQQQ